MPVLDEDRESKRNQELLKTTQGMIASIKAQRAESYKRQGAELERFGGKVLNTYWLIQGAHVSLPLGQVRELAASDELEYIELADGVAKPPADANPDNDLIDARAQIQSDPYFNLARPRAGSACSTPASVRRTRCSTCPTTSRSRRT